MNTYEVTISYIAHTTVTVEANSADEAVDKAANNVGSDDLMSYVVEDGNGKIILDGMF